MKHTLLISAMAITAATASGSAAMAAPADPAYRYSGTHAGGPADDLVRARPTIARTVRAQDPAYRYSGTHAGGPANDLIPRLSLGVGRAVLEPERTITSSTSNEWGNLGGPNAGGGGGGP